MSTFDPNKLGQKAAPEPRARSERVLMAVEQYETPPNSPHFAVGHKLDDPSVAVRVRLNTVAERTADQPSADPERIKALYVTGEFHRESIKDKEKAGIALLSFDDARQVPSNDGVKTYRAHWPNTVSTDPYAEVKIAVGAIVLRDEVAQQGSKARPAQGRVELLDYSALLNKDNAQQVLADAMSNRDGEGRNRDPMMVVRAIYEGNIVATAKVRAERDTTQVYDQNLGENRDIRKPAPAEKSIAMLFEGGSTGLNGVDRGLDRARALLAGVLQMEEPKFREQDTGVVEDFRNLYFGAKSGALEVEVLSGEVIEMGKDTRKTYLANKDRGGLQAYQVEQRRDDDTVVKLQGYTETAVAVRRHDDGDPYVVFAASVAQYPKVATIDAVRVQDRTPVVEAVKEKAAEAPRVRQPEEEESPAP